MGLFTPCKSDVYAQPQAAGTQADGAQGFAGHSGVWGRKAAAAAVAACWAAPAAPAAPELWITDSFKASKSGTEVHFVKKYASTYLKLLLKMNTHNSMPLFFYIIMKSKFTS